jgi:DNA primase
MNSLAIPVFKNSSLINIARYNINKIPGKPKNEYNKNAASGDVVPFDIWKNDFRDTVVCEGEKDMLIARSQGFNAITLTGGSQASLQKDYLEYFKGRKVYICYDNDDAGRRGAIKRYKELCKISDVYITNISSICTLNKEHVADLFVKYDKTHDDFQKLLNDSKKPSEEELNNVKIKNELKLTKIENNIKESSFRKSLKSTLQIIATCTETYAAPEFAIFKPKDNSEENLETKSWYLSSS